MAKYIKGRMYIVEKAIEKYKTTFDQVGSNKEKVANMAFWTHARRKGFPIQLCYADGEEEEVETVVVFDQGNNRDELERRSLPSQHWDVLKAVGELEDVLDKEVKVWERL